MRDELMQEWDEAIRSYKVAESNFQNAEFEYIDASIMLMNHYEAKINALRNEIRIEFEKQANQSNVSIVKKNLGWLNFKMKKGDHSAKVSPF